MDPQTIIPALPAPATVALLGPTRTDIDEAVLHEYAEGLHEEGYRVVSAWDLDGRPGTEARWDAAESAIRDCDGVVVVPGWEWCPQTVELLEEAAVPRGLPIAEFDPSSGTFVPVTLLRTLL